MKPRRFRAPTIFGTPLKYGAPLFIGFTVLISGLDAQGGDILRGGSAGSNKPSRAAAGTATPAATDAARANAKDTLARTTRTLDAVRAMQNAARIAALKNGTNNLGKNPNNPTVTLPNVPNGLVTGGLQITTDPTKWTGAKLPVQQVKKNGNTEVTIQQTTQQALLNWQSFNVGRKTTVTFDQSKGGADVGKWIAFNKITDPTGNPTQILGKIKADGQIYLINPNGIIFGGSSQVNARGLTVSSLPINENLINQGLLNNRDAQFLFSGLSVPGGADGTPDFIPEPPPASGRYGDVTVQPGAILKRPASSGGNGGRITLVGPNVTNAGTISTESGQTLLAAGLQVAMAAHDGNDPSLRGLDGWVGAVGDYAGTVNQTGIIESLTGSTSITGRLINQLGIIESSTSVNLNGRIDLKASYGAIANPNFDSASERGAGGPIFFNQNTGTVTLGEGSVTRILPDYASVKAVPGTELPERSQVNIEGLAVHLDKGSIVLAPNALVSIRAGTWPYKDADGNRTIFDANGGVEDGITNYYSGTTQRFLLDAGQIYVDKGATVNVAGSVDVFVPLAQSILEVEFRGAELADSPLQRESELRGAPLTVDIRQSGAFNGKFWIGTPLGDVTGLAGIIERNAAQLTAVGGDITLQAGESLVLRDGAALDVSGGFYSHEGGMVNTSALLLGGRKVAVKNATPDRVYDGVFSGKSVFTSEKWGITQTFINPLVSGTNQQSYKEGAGGGSLTLTAPSMAIDGELRGITVEGPRQRSVPTAPSSLKITFEADRALLNPGSTSISYFKHSPTPPLIQFADGASSLTVPEFSLVNDLPVALPAERLATVVLSTKLLDEEGFGSLEVNNPDGSIVVPKNVALSAAPKGTVKLAAANLSVFGSIIAPGGVLSFTTYNISPAFTSAYAILNAGGSLPLPLPVADRGLFTLGGEARLSTAGLIADDTPGSPSAMGEAISSAGGEITVNSFNASLSKGGVIDVSGGVYVSDRGSKTYGKAGAISLITGTDVGFPGVIGGTISLGSTLRGYSGSTGGALNIQASLIEVGGARNPSVLHLTEDFFRKGGFTKYSLTGIGAASAATPPPGQFEAYIPAISIAADAKLRPVAESLIAEKNSSRGGAYTLRPYLKADGLRSPVSLSFSAPNSSDDPFTLDNLEVRGDIVMNGGASIVTEPGGNVSFKAGTITLLGSVTAPGGKISIAGAGSFPLTLEQRLAVANALPTVHLGKSARLLAAGVTVLKPDAYGRRVGSVLGGGGISISGNILAEKGGILDVSGTSGVLDLSPSVLAGSGDRPDYLVCGINISPCNTRGVVATRVDSDGGTIDLKGSQMLLSDATLIGSAGGSTAVGGTLSVGSGRFVAPGGVSSTAETNLVVTQSGDVILNRGGELGIGIAPTDPSGAAYGNLGFFSLDRFHNGSFSSLNLDGNVEFRSAIDLKVPDTLRLASGGVIRAENAISIRADYIYVGQNFRAPENPDDNPFQPFSGGANTGFNFPPVFGTGTLSLNAALIDLGTLSLQNVGKAELTAKGGDIRGNGTLSMAGDLTLTAARVYPTSLASFQIFAYDHAQGSGSVTIKTGGGGGENPISAGGHLAVYSSVINQQGVLSAPLGSITLGWDGTDLDPSDSDLDTPFDIIARAGIAAPITGKLTLGSSSITSVAAPSNTADSSWIAPFGISPDGQSWIDPRGVNVSLNGLSEKAVSMSAGDVNMKSGAIVDIRGGGDLFASRWVSGNGGSIDLLGSASTSWIQGTEYEPGDLVSFGGETWSARVRHNGQSPTISTYWSRVAESFAIIPESGMKFAPYYSFNTGSNSGLLGGDPGYVNSNLKVGDTVTLDGSTGVPAGTYTLLPRRYALFPGASLLTPVTDGGVGTVTKADGTRLVSGYTGNRFDGTVAPSERARFEIASAKVLQTRAEYATYSANEFLGELAAKQDTPNPQQLPRDAGYAAFQGSTALQLAGTVRSGSPGRGASVDISSLADIRLIGGAPSSSGGGVQLRTSILNSWNVESLVIGGVRREEAGSTVLDVRTGSLSLENAGGTLSATDVVLVSKGSLKVGDGSSLTASVDPAFTADAFSLRGDGTLLRVSSDATALTTRTGFTGATSALMEIGAAATITGEAVILDSTYGTRLASNLELVGNTLTLGSGQISVVFDDASGLLPGLVVDPHLVLSGSTLDDAFASRNLTLRSYRSIDVYGTGVLGSGDLEQLVLSGSGLRGYEQSGGTAVIRAAQVTFENSINAVSLGAPATSSGSLNVEAAAIRLGANSMAVNGFQNLGLSASVGLIVEGTGAFSTNGNLNVRTPLISGEARTDYSITSAKAMVMERTPGLGSSSGALGAKLKLQAESVKATTDVLLPSGELVIRATAGNLEIGGSLSVEGTSRTFGELVRHADAGKVTLESLTGDVVLGSSGVVSVAAAAKGGSAGEVDILATRGSFVNAGLLKGSSSKGFSSGEFTLDTGSLSATGSGSLASLNAGLDAGSFFDSRSFRVRNGDVAVDHTIRSYRFALAIDHGSILVTGKIDASGITGGAISLAARDNLTIASGSELSVAARQFDSAGKGGSVLLEAGTQSNGAANTSALLDLQAGSTIDLSVAEFVPGAYGVVGSSASQGKFTGTLHLRAPRTAANDDLGISSIQSTITGASSVVAEGFKVYAPAGGILNIAQRNQIDSDARAFLGAAGVGNANEVAMRARLLTGSSSSLDSLLVVSPGAEIINRTGDLILGLANNTSAGITNNEALAAADWNLSTFRYGIRNAPGVLTLRANGDLIFNNTLSDGFNPIARGTAQEFADNGHSQMWLGTLMTISDSLPTNTQSWSYRLTAGADTNASDFRRVLSSEDLDRLQPGKGSLIVGEFYPAVPNRSTTGAAVAIGVNGQTADTIRISTTTPDRGTRFEVVRTGTGDIAISAGRDVQLRNQFSTIYTAGVAIPVSTTVFNTNDFVLPVLPTTVSQHPSQTLTGTLGAIQQLYPANWSMAGGNVMLTAGGNIGRYTLVNGILTVDSTRQMPTNWLYRRAFVDSATGLIASNGGFGTGTSVFSPSTINDVATSTTWWIDYSNFFQGIGTLGGGDIELTAGNDIINVDAVAPTNARMAGRRKNPDFGVIPGAAEYLNLAADAGNLLEWGGGDVTVTAGRNIDGGIYYAEKGAGILNAGGAITTNAARSISLGILDGSAPRDPLTWLPTTLFVGKSRFNVTALGDINLGPITNPFLLPQGLNNKYWYKTYFSTFSQDAGADVLSLGGNVTHRTEITSFGSSSSSSVLQAWYSSQNFFNGIGSARSASNFQPWLRLSELSLSTFGTVFKLFAPSLRSTSMGGDLHLVGDITLAPSASGNLELAAAGGIIGLNPTGVGRSNNQAVQVWTSATVNLSDASVASIPGTVNPLSYQLVAGRTQRDHFQSAIDILDAVSVALTDTGSYTGASANQDIKSALHDSSILHRASQQPVIFNASTGDITGLTLFSPKRARITAGRDISDVALYLQNVSKEDVTLVSAGRDIIPFNESSEVRSVADNLDLAHFVGDSPKATVLGTNSRAAAGDIRISGPGVLEVISGRNLDLGSGQNFVDGTGTGISTIGNLRNPFLPFAGADLIILSGVTSPDGATFAGGLADSSLETDLFIDTYLKNPDSSDSSYWRSLGKDIAFDDLTEEQRAIIALEQFYQVLRDAGRKAGKTGTYKPGYQAVATLFGDAGTGSNILTRSRDIRTTSGGAISVGVPDGGITMASQISGNPLTPPGIVTEYGGSISTFTDQDVDLGQARIFTLRGGDIVMWSSNGDIAAGTSPRTVVTAPPTRVVFDVSSASVQTDLGGLATGGGIGVLAATEGVKAGNVDLIAPRGSVDAGDAGIRVTGNLNIAAQTVLNTGNISAGGTSTGASVAAPSAPSISTVTSASNSAAAANSTTTAPEKQQTAPEVNPAEEPLSIITVDVIGYGGETSDDEEDEDEVKKTTE